MRRALTAHSTRQAQTTLPAVAVALVLLTGVTALGLAMADTAITAADRTPDERRVAAATADRLVAPDGPLGTRANVLNKSRTAAFDGATLQKAAPATAEYDVEVRLGGEPIAISDDASGGTTLRRLVLVERTTEETLAPNGTRVTLPRRVTNATITLTPPAGTTVWTVRANDRVLLSNQSGLRGSFDVELAQYETTQLRFQVAGVLDDDAIEIAYQSPQTTKATLAVTVDA